MKKRISYFVILTMTAGTQLFAMENPSTLGVPTEIIRPQSTPPVSIKSLAPDEMPVRSQSLPPASTKNQLIKTCRFFSIGDFKKFKGQIGEKTWKESGNINLRCGIAKVKQEKINRQQKLINKHRAYMQNEEAKANTKIEKLNQDLFNISNLLGSVDNPESKRIIQEITKLKTNIMINKKIFNNLQNTFGYEITGSTDTTNQCRFFPIGRGHEGKGYVACADSNIVFKAQPNTCRTNTSSKMPELSGIGSYTYNGTRCHLVPVK